LVRWRLPCRSSYWTTGRIEEEAEKGNDGFGIRGADHFLRRAIITNYSGQGSLDHPPLPFEHRRLYDCDRFLEPY